MASGLAPWLPGYHEGSFARRWELVPEAAEIAAGGEVGEEIAA
jgi:hypothetical protein